VFFNSPAMESPSSTFLYTEAALSGTTPIVDGTTVAAPTASTATGAVQFIHLAGGCVAFGGYSGACAHAGPHVEPSKLANESSPSG
jgi:hypothetical protein